MKRVNFYKSIVGLYIAEFAIKGESKLRRLCCGSTLSELFAAAKRYEKKGYYITYCHVECTCDNITLLAVND